VTLTPGHIIPRQGSGGLAALICLHALVLPRRTMRSVSCNRRASAGRAESAAAPKPQSLDRVPTHLPVCVVELPCERRHREIRRLRMPANHTHRRQHNSLVRRRVQHRDQVRHGRRGVGPQMPHGPGVHRPLRRGRMRSFSRYGLQRPALDADERPQRSRRVERARGSAVFCSTPSSAGTAERARGPSRPSPIAATSRRSGGR